MNKQFGAGIFTLVGVAVFIFGINVFNKAKASENWPNVQGTITSSTVDRKLDTSNNSSSNRRSKSGVSVSVGSVNVSSGSRKYKYTPRVAYSFVVDEENYTGTKISPMTTSYSSERSAKNVLRDYKLGFQTTVFYNPSKPSDSLLKPGVTVAVYFPMVFGLIFAAVGVFMLIKPE